MRHFFFFRNRQMKRKSPRGFTLIEIVVSLAIFSIMMASVSHIFGMTFIGYRNLRAIQRDIDNAQYALNIMAKELRTSSIDGAGGSNQSSVRFYDHSQGKCIRYSIDGGSLLVASVAASSCAAATLLNATVVSTGVITGAFQVTPSAAGTVGKVTVTLDISEGSSHHARIQTTVSLRDFAVSGI